MKAVFISDAHLKDEGSKRYHNLLSLLDAVKDTIDALFIVGDFFDFWFCDNGNIYPEFRIMIDKLLDLRNHGVAINYFEGNHDFYLDEFFGTFGVRIFQDGATFKLDDQKIFVSHGDTVDLSNRPYLVLRSFLRSRIFYMMQKGMPSAVLWRVARISSKMSKDHLARSPEGLADTMRNFSMRKFEEGYDAVILGHCHQPVLEQYVIGGRKRTFAIPGDWVDHCSYIQYVDGDFTHSRIPSE